jgi:hypothetical protein
VAKQEFQLFDKILSIQNIFTKKPPSMQSSDPIKRAELRQMSKKNTEIAGLHAQDLIAQVIGFEEERSKITDFSVDLMVKNIVLETQEELIGQKQLEK